MPTSDFGLKRHRTARALLILGVIAVVAGLVGSLVLEFQARRWEAKWRAFRTEWERKGENFAVSKPPKADDREDVLKHPWFANNPDPSDVVIERLSPARIEGYNDWDIDENRLMAPELAKAVLDHYSASADDLDAIREAAKRPFCRVSINLDPDHPPLIPELKTLSAVSDAIQAHACAALSAGDSDRFAGDIELLLDLGAKLRENPSFLPMVIGAGFEAKAFQSLKQFSNSPVGDASIRSRLLTALEFRKRSLGEELAAVLRHERNQSLRLIDRLLEKPTPPPEVALPKLRSSARAFASRNRLALCEDLQHRLLAPSGTVLTAITAAGITDYEQTAKERFAKNKPDEESLAATCFHASVGVLDATLRHEDARTEIRAVLAATPRSPESPR
ncbi:MAG: hypothetical protein J0M04_15250 [Verrucomicrobia bacterium]|nr:hypothetical protein [Verrucomicrobiota bacterium]